MSLGSYDMFPSAVPRRTGASGVVGRSSQGSTKNILEKKLKDFFEKLDHDNQTDFFVGD
jgi:hypothetical protein